jgi:tRNA (cmo5U34)-methyltransferase
VREVVGEQATSLRIMSGREWLDTDSARRWLKTSRELVPADEARRFLVEQVLPDTVTTVLDLGTGDGALIAAVRERWPAAAAVGLDLSSPLLDRARSRFGGSAEVSFLSHDLMEPLPAAVGAFDVVLSSLAIHHLPDRRKRELFDEVFSLLEPGGVFGLLDVVASPTPELHERAQAALGFGDQDRHPSDQPARLEDQLAWLREAGFDHVDCFWKWLELAVVAGTKPS